MNTISNSTIKAIISRKEITEFIESGEDTNAKQEQNSTYSPLTPTKNNSSQIITTKKDNKTNECK